MNKNYIKGRNKEYKIIKQLKEEGFSIAQRSAGSHSPFDIFALNSINREILLVQCKPDKWTVKQINDLEEQYSYLNGAWLVKFIVL